MQLDVKMEQEGEDGRGVISRGQDPTPSGPHPSRPPGPGSGSTRPVTDQIWVQRLSAGRAGGRLVPFPRDE